VRDAFAAWKNGTPAVVRCHEPFDGPARQQSQTPGAPAPAIIVYKQDAPALESDAALDAKARDVAEAVLRAFSG
jgi:hypothetical protein